jgi:hypothetical protein
MFIIIIIIIYYHCLHSYHCLFKRLTPVRRPRFVFSGVVYGGLAAGGGRQFHTMVGGVDRWCWCGAVVRRLCFCLMSVYVSVAYAHVGLF